MAILDGSKRIRLSSTPRCLVPKMEQEKVWPNVFWHAFAFAMILATGLLFLRPFFSQSTKATAQPQLPAEANSAQTELRFGFGSKVRSYSDDLALQKEQADLEAAATKTVTTIDGITTIRRKVKLGPTAEQSERTQELAEAAFIDTKAAEPGLRKHYKLGGNGVLFGHDPATVSLPIRESNPNLPATKQ